MDNGNAGASTRQLKVAKELQKDLAEIIRSKGMAMFGGAMVSVTEVRISPDLSVVKVYVSIFPSSKAEAALTTIHVQSAANSAVSWPSSSALCLNSCSIRTRHLIMSSISMNC